MLLCVWLTTGNMAAFAEKYNYVLNDSYAIGSASQDYITNTHMKLVRAHACTILTTIPTCIVLCDRSVAMRDCRMVRIASMSRETVRVPPPQVLPGSPG